MIDVNPIKSILIGAKAIRSIVFSPFSQNERCLIFLMSLTNTLGIFFNPP